MSDCFSVIWSSGHDNIPTESKYIHTYILKDLEKASQSTFTFSIEEPSEDGGNVGVCTETILNLSLLAISFMVTHLPDREKAITDTEPIYSIINAKVQEDLLQREYTGWTQGETREDVDSLVKIAW